MEEEISFIKRICKVVRESKEERSPYYEGKYKSILINLREEDWDIFENILKKLKKLKKE